MTFYDNIHLNKCQDVCKCQAVISANSVTLHTREGGKMFHELCIEIMLLAPCQCTVVM